ncbi:potassium channel protein [soil metagenome]
MKTLGLMLATMSTSLQRWNVRIVVWLVIAFVTLVGAYSAIFHWIMALEGREFSWTTSVYWVLTVMSTLGFGDITFQNDLGRAFSILVLITGASFILVLLPFVFIQFIFTPWMQARESARAPRSVPDDLRDHLVLTNLDAVTDALIQRARNNGVPYVLIVPEVEEALRLHDLGYVVMRGEIDDPTTYRAARVEHAALVATTRADTTNTNVAFTVRERSSSVRIVATANSGASVDILELAGCDQVLQLGMLLGQGMARRVLGGDHCAHVIGSFGDIRIAEVNIAGTQICGKRVVDVDLRNTCGVNIIGVWQRGMFERVLPDSRLRDGTVLILAGTDAQLEAYDRLHGTTLPIDRPVVILGGGRVGRAAAAALQQRGISSTIVEQQADRIRPGGSYVQGDAADLAVLRAAGLDEASAVLVTTHTDDINVYLTLYCRKLRPDIQVISRAVLDRNVSTLHRAGADAVLSYASLGATAIWNELSPDDRLVIAEGLEVFLTPVPTDMAGSSLQQADVGATTGCTVVAVQQNGVVRSNPDPAEPLDGEAHLVVIGDDIAERRFMDRYPVGH